MNKTQTQIPFIDLQAQYREYKHEIQREMDTVLDSSAYIMGPKIGELETALADYVGRPYCLSCSSGTDALFLILKALGVTKGDQVIVPAFSFFATSEVVDLLGAVPVFVDVCEDTFNIDPVKVEAAVSLQTKAIIPVSLFGQVYRSEAIDRIASEYEIPVVEDGAQSFGALRNGKRSPSFGMAGCTSFFPAKPLGAYGDAGAIFVADPQLYERLQELRNHGQSARYTHSSIGINGRLDSLQAAVLLVKLRHYDEELELRQAVSTRYFDGLSDLDYITLPSIDEANTSVFAQFTVMVEDRESFVEWMTENGIPTAIHYPIPLYRQPVYLDRGYDPADFPVSEHVSARVVSLPFSAFLSADHQQRIIEAIRKWKGGR
jgi:UDP-2-acetamido-2-deoxy-ribo-hexuluronate aminotransferase